MSITERDREAASIYEAENSEEIRLSDSSLMETGSALHGAFLAACAYKDEQYRELVEFCEEGILKSYGSLHKPIYMIHLKEKLRKLKEGE